MMKRLSNIINAAFLVSIVIMAASCAGESILSKESQGDAALKINMQVPQQNNVSTRALTLSSNESTVSDLTILIFNSDNQLIGEGYTSSPTSTGTNTYQMTVSTREATGCTIYAVANAGENAFSSENSTVSGVSNAVNTVDEFKAAYAKLSTASGLGSQNNVIMQGVLTNQNITASTQTLSTTIPLYRLCTKMNFNIIPSSDITITGYQLHEVPMSSYIADRSEETTPVYNPSGTYGDLDAVTESSPTAGSEVTDTYYMYENLAGTASASSTAKARNSTNAPAKASYMDVYATGSNWKSTYRIYLGGTGTTDYTNYNVPRNYNYTYTINITGSGIYDVRVTCYPELINSSTAGTWSSNGSASTVTSSATATVGDYYYSDGTWGSLANNPGKTPIAVVFSASTSTTDQGHGWIHGYAMALTNASTGCQWSANTTTYPSMTTTDESVLTDYTGDYTTFITNKDGYTETQAIKNAYSSSLQNDHPAFWYALNFGTSNESGTTDYAAPSSSSGWYLPSVGQWWNIVINLGKMSTTVTNHNSGWCRWYGGDTGGGSINYAKIFITNINSYLTAVSSIITPDYFSYNDSNGNPGEYYWSSTEYNNSYCFFAYSGDLATNGNTGLDTDRSKNKLFFVRACIAF